MNGTATLSGTVSCNKATTVELDGPVAQVNKGLLVRGSFFKQLACEPGAPVPWTATARPEGVIPFDKGYAEVIAFARGFDADYGTHVVVSSTTVVKLDKVKP